MRSVFSRARAAAQSRSATIIALPARPEARSRPRTRGPARIARGCRRVGRRRCRTTPRTSTRSAIPTRGALLPTTSRAEGSWIPFADRGVLPRPRAPRRRPHPGTRNAASCRPRASSIRSHDRPRSNRRALHEPGHDSARHRPRGPGSSAPDPDPRELQLRLSGAKQASTERLRAAFRVTRARDA